MSALPILCDQRGDRCCGTPACLDAGLWTDDPYDAPVFVQGHSHSEPVCAWPDCETYLTRSGMATLRAQSGAACWWLLACPALIVAVTYVAALGVRW